MRTCLSLLLVIFLIKAQGQQFNTIVQVPLLSTVNMNATSVDKSPILIDSIVQNPTSKVLLDGDSTPMFLQNLSPSLPLSSLQLTSPYGYRTHPVTGEARKFHSGIDLKARADTVFSILPGTVIASGKSKFLGNYVEIKHGDYTSIYGHLSTRFVKTDQTVSAGYPLGITGKTGRVTGEHLHFTVKYKKSYINPLIFLSTIATYNGIELFAFLTASSEKN